MLIKLTLTCRLVGWLTLPFYDFCGFRSVAVNSMYKLQFFYIYLHYTRSLSAQVRSLLSLVPISPIFSTWIRTRCPLANRRAGLLRLAVSHASLRGDVRRLTPSPYILHYILPLTPIPLRWVGYSGIMRVVGLRPSTIRSKHYNTQCNACYQIIIHNSIIRLKCHSLSFQATSSNVLCVYNVVSIWQLVHNLVLRNRLHVKLTFAL